MCFGGGPAAVLLGDLGVISGNPAPAVFGGGSESVLGNRGV